MMKKIIALLFLSIYSFAQTGKPQAIDNLATPLFKGITLRKQVTPVTPTLGLRLANVGDRLVTKDSLGVVKQYLISSDVSGVYAPLANPTFTGTVSLPSTTSIGSVNSTELGYIDGVTSNIQTQLNTKFDASNSVFESPLTFVQLTNPSTGAITNSVGIPQSSAFGSGYLSSTDWSTFNLKAPTANPTFTTNATSPKFTVTGSGYIANGSDVAMGAGSTADIVTYNTSGRILFSTAGSVRLAITNAGNFGIGTIAPTSKFEVSGTSSIRYNDGGQADGKYLRSNSTGIASWSSIALSEITGLGTGVATFLATPSSANLATALTDETGTGNAVFSASPTITGTLTTSVIANTAGANLATSSGRVGIGTTSPNAPLQFSNNVEDRKITLYETGNNIHQVIGIGLTSNGHFKFQTSATTIDYVFNSATSSTASNELFRIKGNGNVGIGTTSPVYTLDVNGDINIPQSSVYRIAGNAILQRNTSFWNYIYDFSNSIALQLGGTSDAINYYNNTQHVFKSRNGVSEYLRIFSSGNVGIGTATNAGYKLDVNGTARFVNGVNLATTSGNVGIGTTSPIATLDVNGYAKLKSYTTTEINAIASPTAGMIAYNSTIGALCFYDGTSWKRVSHSAM